MDEAKFENKLNDLVKEFGQNSNPQTQKLADLAKQARKSHDQLKKSITNLMGPGIKKFMINIIALLE